MGALAAAVGRFYGRWLADPAPGPFFPCGAGAWHRISWHATASSPALHPAAVASPAQARALLAAVTRLRPDLAAFFGCLYYAALRPEKPSPSATATASSPPPDGACSPDRDRAAHRRRLDQ